MSRGRTAGRTKVAIPLIVLLSGMGCSASGEAPESSPPAPPSGLTELSPSEAPRSEPPRGRTWLYAAEPSGTGGDDNHDILGQEEFDVDGVNYPNSTLLAVSCNGPEDHGAPFARFSTSGYSSFDTILTLAPDSPDTMEVVVTIDSDRRKQSFRLTKQSQEKVHLELAGSRTVSITGETEIGPCLGPASFVAALDAALTA